MKIVLLVSLFLASYGVVTAQGIMVYINGEQQIKKLADVNVNNKAYMETRGTQCGDYLMYKEISDQRIVSFMYFLTGKQDVPLGEYPEHIDVRGIEFKSDKTVSTPSAEWVGQRQRKKMVIRLSPKEYKAVAKCLPMT